LNKNLLQFSGVCLINHRTVRYAGKMIYDQSEYDIVCEWGAEGVSTLAPTADVVIVVDVLTFTTCVEFAVDQGAIVYPYRWRDETMYDFAEKVYAQIADRNNPNGYSLAVTSLQNLPADTRLVLPSPNGSTVSLLAANTPVIAGCLRNCRAVAEYAMSRGKRVAVIPAGERWKNNDTLRPSVEDLLGAGAIISYLRGRLSPEALTAKTVYDNLFADLIGNLKNCVSGREKSARG
jgi:2-phosphosulfolactate phosphatase